MGQQHKDAVELKSETKTDAQNYNLNNKKNEEDYINNHLIPVQDSTSDGNKIVNSIVQGLLTGGAGAVAGAITSNSGNMTVDIVNSTTSATARSRPKVDDPDVAAAEASQKPIRGQNLVNNINNILQQ
ncbi:hypothetical protein [Commensalibacter oyaizuii]|uniref:Uncharacterized protein n=1 Tax=Commensalibacter oyaizuii TaxID=3043873 RepID=A0ABT6PZM6_9PROT|nr:hypothetical protein [Commensalibacter sp. TBRC 16381]MDI2090168.1 hypothetical protein [Commensalibacter sp. TBRC 16381]